MVKELPLFIRREFVVERNQHATREENGIGRNQPLRLIRHDDAGAVSSSEACILQSLCHRMRALLEITIGEPLFLAIAVGFDQTHFAREAVQRITQRFSNGLIFGKVQHYRRDCMRSAKVLKSLTPWTS